MSKGAGVKTTLGTSCGSADGDLWRPANLYHSLESFSFRWMVETEIVQYGILRSSVGTAFVLRFYYKAALRRLPILGTLELHVLICIQLEYSREHRLALSIPFGKQAYVHHPYSAVICTEDPPLALEAAKHYATSTTHSEQGMF